MIAATEPNESDRGYEKGLSPSVFTDQERLKMFLKALPEHRVRILYSTLTVGESILDDHLDMLEGYFRHLGDSRVFLFDAQPTQKAYERFVKAAGELHSYIESDFWPRPEGGAFAFYPEKQDGAEKHSPKSKEFEGVRQLATDFMQAYENFLDTAARSLGTTPAHRERGAAAEGKSWQAPDALSLSKYWIVGNKRDGYLFDGQRINFPNPEAGYVKIFDAVLFLAPCGGPVDYDKIERKCPGKTPKSIQRALTGENPSFFEYVKGVKRIPSDRPLFQATRTKDNKLIFNNER